MSIELFDNLEVKIDKILERDNQMQHYISELKETISQKDRTIQELKESAQDLESEKAQIKVRMDNIINKLDGLLLTAEGNHGPSENSDSWA